jgi:predicted porin
MVLKRLHGAKAGMRASLICATAIVSVASLAHADELQDLKRQTDLLQRQNQMLMRRIEGIEKAQRSKRSGLASASQSLDSTGPGPGYGAAPATATNGYGVAPGGVAQYPSTGSQLQGNATSSSGPAADTGTGTVQEQRTVGAAPAAAAIGGTPPIPANKALTYLGVTLYGAVDLGVAYQTHGTPLSSQYGPGLEELISRNSNRSLVSLVPNALSYSNIGLRGTEPVLPGLAAVFNVQTSFLPTSGQLSNGTGSQAQNNGVALNRQSSNGDSSRAGQAFNAAAYLGLSSPRYGTITFGRQNALTLDGVVAYDPMFASNAFSVIGFQGATAGAGDTEDARLDASVKYLVNYGPIHAGAMIQLSGQNGKSVNATNSGGRDDYQFDVGATLGGLNVDAIYSQIYDAVSTSALTAAQVTTSPVGSVFGSVSDNAAFMLLGKYKIGKLQAFIGYENILYSNPRDPLGAGSTSLGGYALGTINNTSYTNNKLLQIYWGGLRYAVTPKFSADVAYYREHQNSYSGNGCANTSVGSCRGDLNAYSLLLDYRLSPRFDVYAGAMLSTVSNGLASGFLYNTTIDPTIGARFAF